MTLVPYVMANDKAHVEQTQENRVSSNVKNLQIRSFEILIAYPIISSFLLVSFATVLSSRISDALFSFLIVFAFSFVHYLQSFLNSSNTITFAITMMFSIDRDFFFLYHFIFFCLLFFFSKTSYKNTFFYSETFTIFSSFLFVRHFICFNQTQ